jgi:hypothetical protein
MSRWYRKIAVPAGLNSALDLSGSHRCQTWSWVSRIGGELRRSPRPLKEVGCGLIGNVDVAVTVAWELRFQPSAAPQRARLVAEKLAAHVIVDADDVQALGGKTASSRHR